MKTITIKHPWAQLICMGIKDVENRTWKTNYRGRLLIHASAQPAESDPEKIERLIRGSSSHGNDRIQQTRAAGLLPIDFTKRNGSQLRPQNGAIIGHVTLDSISVSSESAWADYDSVVGVYHWKLVDPVLYKRPILGVKGQLNLWEYNITEQEITAAVI